MAYKKILIVDDEEEVLKLLEKKLSAEEFYVIKAARGREAIQKAKVYLPDLILMDIMLPDLDGSEAVKLIKKDLTIADIPIIFLSGIITKGEPNQKPTVTVAGFEYPAIGKPFEFRELLFEIRKVLSPGSFPPNLS